MMPGSMEPRIRLVGWLQSWKKPVLSVSLQDTAGGLNGPSFMRPGMLSENLPLHRLAFRIPRLASAAKC